jgi:hypothetical protein
LARTPRKKTARDAARDKRATAPRSPEGAVTDAGTGRPRPAGSAERRRRELEERQAALARAEPRQTAEQPRGPSPSQANDMLARWLASQDDDLRAFVASRSAQMDQRRYQLSLIKDFVDDPTRFGIKPGDVPTSTTLAEFAERRAELQYRINMVRTFLDLLNEELRLLDQAEAYAREQAGASEG